MQNLETRSVSNDVSRAILDINKKVEFFIEDRAKIRT